MSRLERRTSISGRDDYYPGLLGTGTRSRTVSGLETPRYNSLDLQRSRDMQYLESSLKSARISQWAASVPSKSYAADPFAPSSSSGLLGLDGRQRTRSRANSLAKYTDPFSSSLSTNPWSSSSLLDSQFSLNNYPMGDLPSRSRSGLGGLSGLGSGGLGDGTRSRRNSLARSSTLGDLPLRSSTPYKDPFTPSTSTFSRSLPKADIGDGFFDLKPVPGLGSSSRSRRRSLAPMDPMAIPTSLPVEIPLAPPPPKTDDHPLFKRKRIRGLGPLPSSRPQSPPFDINVNDLPNSSPLSSASWGSGRDRLYDYEGARRDAALYYGWRPK